MSATCWNKKCKATAVAYEHFAWWCGKHRVGSTPNPVCTHSLSGDTIHCSYCGGIIP